MPDALAATCLFFMMKAWTELRRGQLRRSERGVCSDGLKDRKCLCTRAVFSESCLSRLRTEMSWSIY